MTELRILGPAEMRNSQGELEHSFLAGPKRLALLVYLLLHKPHGFHRRDSLLPVFWPEQDQKSARNSLSNMLYHIRKTLGTHIIENRGSEEIAINPELFWCDAVAFEKALREKEPETALNLYRNDLLKGFHVQEASFDFDHWLEQERNRFHTMATDASLDLASKVMSGRENQSVKHWGQKAAELNPFSEDIQLRVISLLDEAGEPAAALETYNTYARLIKREFEEEPGSNIKTLAEKINTQRVPVPKIAGNREPIGKELSQFSIAVLPFETLGSEKASAFTDAIHGDILTRLSQISDLFVISKTSVQSFRSTKKVLPEIALELQVGWILTGDVQEINQQVKVSVRLVNASEDRQVWAEIYQRKLTAGELFNIQAEITQKITEALKMQLSNKEHSAIRQVPTEDLEAFRLHAYGRWHLDQHTEEAMELAENYFRQAISHDKNYAQAWMGLADVLTLRHNYGHKESKVIIPEAEEAAQRARKLDPGMSGTASEKEILGRVEPKKNGQDIGKSFFNKSIAVLPFKDLESKEPRFTDGIHGDILASLSRIKDLQVISRSSVCRYERKGKEAKEIGEELRVSWLLEGEVKQTSDDINLNVILIKTATDAGIWKKNYHQTLSAENIFLIEEEVTKDLLEVLKIHLSGKEKQRATRSSTTNLDAYRLYTQGRSCLDQRTEAGIYQGLDCFQGSIELDPDYALAWSGLADAMSLLQFYGFPIPRNSPGPIEAATRAVELNKDLSEAHTSLGIFYSINQQGPAALQELELAVDLSPGYAEALIWLGWVNLVLGRPKKAVKPAKQAVRLNPLSPAFRVFLSEIYLANRLQEESLTEARRAREINPEYGLAHYMEGLVLYHADKFEEAVSAFEKALSIIPSRGTPTQNEVNMALAFTYHALGNKEWGLELKNEIYGRIDPFPLAMLQVLFGELDEAFTTFKRVQDWSSFSTEIIRYFFPKALSSLKKDKRFLHLIANVNEAVGLPADGKLL